jgi:hypothetical protein
MMRPISKRARSPVGARVSVECTLPADQRQAIVCVYTATPGFDLSPYVDVEKLGVQSRERPIMHKPFYTTLRTDTPAHTFEFIASESMFVQVLQDVDIASDASAKAKVKVHGKFTQKVGWFLRDAIGSIRNSYASLYRHNPR